MGKTSSLLSRTHQSIREGRAFVTYDLLKTPPHVINMEIKFWYKFWRGHSNLTIKSTLHMILCLVLLGFHMKLHWQSGSYDRLNWNAKSIVPLSRCPGTSHGFSSGITGHLHGGLGFPDLPTARQKALLKFRSRIGSPFWWVETAQILGGWFPEDHFWRQPACVYLVRLSEVHFLVISRMWLQIVPCSCDRITLGFVDHSYISHLCTPLGFFWSILK